MASLGEMFDAGAVETFLGLPRCRDLGRVQAKMVLIGADGCTPYPSVGFYCAGGPAVIRAGAKVTFGAAYAATLGQMNFDLGGAVFPGAVSTVDAGDLQQDIGDPEGNRARIFGADFWGGEHGAGPGRGARADRRR